MELIEYLIRLCLSKELLGLLLDWLVRITMLSLRFSSLSCLLVLSFVFSSVHSQSTAMYGVVGNHLVTIDPVTAAVTDLGTFNAALQPLKTGPPVLWDLE